VRDDDERAGPVAQLRRQVGDSGVVEVVRRLVEHQQVGAFADPRGQAHAVALADRQGGALPARVARGAEPGQRLVGSAVRVPGGQVLVARDGGREPAGVARLVVERGDRARQLVGRRARGRERALEDVADRGAARSLELLLDDRQRAVPAHLAALRHQLAGEDSQQRRLARAVLPHQPQPCPGGHDEVEVVEHHATRVAERHVLGDQLDLCRVRAGHQPPSARVTAGTSARNACPRWLIAFFSSGASSAHVRVSPSGTRTGS
jgi:hypothetical protein